jgi:hypothetical protein
MSYGDCHEREEQEPWSPILEGFLEEVTLELGHIGLS